MQLYKTNEARAYILSQPGEEYTVHYSSRRAPGEAAPTDLAVTLDVDGARLAMQRVIRTSPAPIGSKERECKFEGFRSTEVRSLLQAAPWLTLLIIDVRTDHYQAFPISLRSCSTRS